MRMMTLIFRLVMDSESLARSLCCSRRAAASTRAKFSAYSSALICALSSWKSLLRAAFRSDRSRVCSFMAAWLMLAREAAALGNMPRAGKGRRPEPVTARACSAAGDEFWPALRLRKGSLLRKVWTAKGLPPLIAELLPLLPP